VSVLMFNSFPLHFFPTLQPNSDVSKNIDYFGLLWIGPQSI